MTKVYISYKENHWLQREISFSWNSGLEEMSRVDREHAVLPWRMFLATSLRQGQRRSKGDHSIEHDQSPQVWLIYRGQEKMVTGWTQTVHLKLERHIWGSQSPQTVIREERVCKVSTKPYRVDMEHPDYTLPDSQSTQSVITINHSCFTL